MNTNLLMWTGLTALLIIGLIRLCYTIFVLRILHKIYYFLNGDKTKNTNQNNANSSKKRGFFPFRVKIDNEKESSNVNFKQFNNAMQEAFEIINNHQKQQIPNFEYLTPVDDDSDLYNDNYAQYNQQIIPSIHPVNMPFETEEVYSKQQIPQKVQPTQHIPQSPQKQEQPINQEQGTSAYDLKRQDPAWIKMMQDRAAKMREARLNKKSVTQEHQPQQSHELHNDLHDDLNQNNQNVNQNIQPKPQLQTYQNIQNYQNIDNNQDIPLKELQRMIKNKNYQQK